MLQKSLYPLGHTPHEVERLESQAKLFNDTLLAELASQANQCLELGTGVGSNWPILQRINPRLQFTGIDNSNEAITLAKKAHSDSPATFSVMDATDLHYSDNSFDLVFSKLVLWSIGEKWLTVFDEVLRVLKPGGVFYVYEPYDKGILFSPPRPSLELLIQQWGTAALQSGLDPHIGPKVSLAAIAKGFQRVQTKLYPVSALSNEHDKYATICNNLKNFYFGNAANNLGLILNKVLREQALAELSSTNTSLVMDTFFVTWGYKSQIS